MYNGYPNYNLWNVSLWINNDEGLYTMAREIVRRKGHGREAARAIRDSLADCGLTRTPDGAPYTLKGIIGAIRGL